MEHSNWVDAETESQAVGGYLVSISESGWLIATCPEVYTQGHYGDLAHSLAWIGVEKAYKVIKGEIL